jgi:cobaltochelatase CobS
VLTGATLNALNELSEKIDAVSQRPILHVQINDAPKVVIEDHVHPVFEKVLRLTAAGVNVLLKGPAGCGKTHLCEMVAKQLGREFGAISGSAGASESQLVGRLLPTGDGGKFEYHASPFVSLYESGGCFLFDELDAFDPNMLLVSNTATANGHFTVEARSNCPNVVRHKNTILLAAANTYGNGPDALFVGRNQLDASTLDRWYTIEMDYDTAFEKQLATPEIVNWVWQLREKVQAAKLRRVVSTRMIQKAHVATGAGVPWAEVKRDLLNGWTRDELAKVGE